MRIFFTGILLLLTVGLLVTFAFINQSEAISTSWYDGTVDSEGAVGRYTSLALDSSGNPHISYYDESNADLKYASTTTTAFIPTLIEPLDNSTYSWEPMTFDWDDVPGVTMYGIEFLDAPPEPWEENNQAPSIHRIGARFTGVESWFPGDTSNLDVGEYWWRIIGFGSKGFQGVFSDAFKFTVEANEPELLAPPDNSKVGWEPLTFDWTDVPGATMYGIELLDAPPESLEENNQAESVHRIGAGFTGKESWFLRDTSNLAPGEYWWRIIAFGQYGFQSVFSDAWSFNVLPPPRPALMSPLDSQQVAKGPVIFDWSDVEEVSGYGIELLNAPPENPNSREASMYRIGATIVPGGALSQYLGNASDLIEGETYWWRVISIKNGQLFGVFSDALSFTVGPQGQNQGSFIWPTYGTVTCTWGWHDCNVHVGRPHHGLDIEANSGTNVVAPANGIVVHVYWSDAVGNIVEIDHGGGITTRYCHLLDVWCSNGQYLYQGDSIGTSWKHRLFESWGPFAFRNL